MQPCTLFRKFIKTEPFHFVCPVQSPGPLCQGSAHFLDDDRKDALVQLAATLRAEYPQYGRACRYLETLAGQFARPVEDIPQIQFVLAGGNPPVQRGSPTLEPPEPYQVHRMNVRFHRYN